MNIKKIAILSLIVIMTLSVDAQRKRKRVIKKPVVVEEPQEDPRITNMRQMTQQIIFIDSIVTDKDSFLDAIRLSQETGNVMTCQQFFGKDEGLSNGMLFENEMGNKIYFSLPDDSLRQQLYTSDKLGHEWGRYTPLQGISDGIIEASYPFMLTDGITLYFAGKGDNSIGGYDIFFTRYDSSSGRFLMPENLGMPFNSEANDYMYAVDEQNRIGYFVSDRRQPEGKVCVYVFIPNDTRQTYDLSSCSEEQIVRYADISSIADTWGNGIERKAAMARYKTIGSKSRNQKQGQVAEDSIYLLVINDALTYTSSKDFHSKKAAGLYQQLVKARQQYTQQNEQLDKSRNYYAKAKTAEKNSLAKEILLLEENTVQLSNRIRSLEKQVRNTEINAIKQ